MKAKNTKTSERVRKQLRRHVKLTLVPHGANQYRPHIIRARGLVVMAALIAGFQILYSLSTGGTVLGVQQNISANDLYQQTNTEREANHLPRLQLSDQLSKAASLKAQDMFRQQYWAHTAPDGTTPWHWFGVVGYDYTYAGENLAKDFVSAAGITTAWMASPDHRANILNTHYTEVGFAVVDGKLSGQETTLVVALYGQPVSSLAAATSGVSTHVATETMPATGQSMTTWARLAAAASSFTPVALVTLLLLTIAAMVALVAHIYRNKLPKPLQQSWYRHHGLYKFVGFISLLIIVISLYSSGQI
ncbi:MAG TPA: CAP domain-containing protein [Candidatus Saccharimonadales bacterium]